MKNRVMFTCWTFHSLLYIWNWRFFPKFTYSEIYWKEEKKKWIWLLCYTFCSMFFWQRLTVIRRILNILMGLFFWFSFLLVWIFNDAEFFLFNCLLVYIVCCCFCCLFPFFCFFLFFSRNVLNTSFRRYDN